MRPRGKILTDEYIIEALGKELSVLFYAVIYLDSSLFLIH